MSLLSQVYATPSRVKGVVQLFTRERGQKLKRETATSLLSPASLLKQTDDPDGGGRAMIEGVIDECVRLGLLREENDVLILDPDLPPNARKYETVAGSLPGVILDRVLDPRAAANSDLALALAWFLGQDVLGAPGTWQEFGSALVTQGANEALPFNDTRFKMFAYWARYLGLATAFAIAKNNQVTQRIAPDPTEALRRLTPAIRATRGDRVSIADFLQEARARCPLFEGGEVRNLMDQFSPRRDLKHLSSTTSHALLVLEEDGTLELRMLSDADALLLVDGPRPRSVSEIGWRTNSMEAA